MRKIILIGCIILFSAYSNYLMAHAEHDKARYVAANGADQGRCDNPSKPCQSIRYAAQHANKGDNIRVAEGSYAVDDSDTLFYLLSQTLPIKGRFSRKDEFEKQNDNYVTQLTGVPLSYAKQLSDKGFKVIVDGKGTNRASQIELQKNLIVFEQMKQFQAEQVCNGGLAGSFECNKVDLLAHIPLSSFSTNPFEANDIWGHYDLNNGNEYALIGLRNGIGIVNVTDPLNPVVVTTIASQSTIWRDIKVYQYFDHSINQWKSYAYVTADNATVGLMIIDLNDLPNSATLLSTMSTDLSAHNVYLSNVDYSTGVELSGATAYLHIAGSNRNGGAFNSYGLTNPEALTTVYRPTDATRNDYTHDVASMIIRDSRKDTQCVNGGVHCEIFFDFNEDSFRLWDKTNNSNPALLSNTSYANANYVHSGWYTEDKLVVIVHDELDEQNAGLNTTVRFFEMSNLTAPTQIATWTGSTRAIDHNGFVRGNRYYMSNYERGMTVLDITDPSAPTEVGFFDTYPFNNSASFNGAWGIYPFLPSGNILVSDINSGLYILRDRTTLSPQGSLKFSQNNYDVAEGASVTVSVNRVSGSQGAIQVGWELTKGAADETDFVAASGILSWTDGDTSAKSFDVTTLADNNGEGNEVFFTRLFDPKSGATLNSPSLATITIGASLGNNIPSVYAGKDKAATAGESVTLSATATDLDGGQLVYQWQQIAGPSVTLQTPSSLQMSFTASQVGNYEFSFTATDPQGNSASDNILVTIQQANALPIVDAGADIQVFESDLVRLLATASDPDLDVLTVNWTQTAGVAVTLTTPTSLETSFTAPSIGSYSFEVQVSDGRGGVVTDSVTVTASAKPVVLPPPTPVQSGGGGSLGIIGLILILIGLGSRKIKWRIQTH
ncbi:MAG: choice-of-anchor B family protein [Enterobacterales bacterium]|nr:choice-of-anchor B family protein [Enterobacterales bacterium]